MIDHSHDRLINVFLRHWSTHGCVAAEAGEVRVRTDDKNAIWWRYIG